VSIVLPDAHDGDLANPARSPPRPCRGIDAKHRSARLAPRKGRRNRGNRGGCRWSRKHALGYRSRPRMLLAGRILCAARHR
jgi:hypothetical protein